MPGVEDHYRNGLYWYCTVASVCFIYVNTIINSIWSVIHLRSLMIEHDWNLQTITSWRIRGCQSSSRIPSIVEIQFLPWRFNLLVSRSSRVAGTLDTQIHRNVYDNFLLMGPKRCCQLCNAREKSIILFNIFSERWWAVSKCVSLFIQFGIQILQFHTRNVFEGLVGAPFRRDPKIGDVVTRLNVLNCSGSVVTTFDSETSANLEDLKKNWFKINAVPPMYTEPYPISRRAKGRKDCAHAFLMKYNTPAHLTVFNKEAARLHRMIRSYRCYHKKRLALTTSNSPKLFLLM